MKFVIVLVALFGLALAAPVDQQAETVRNESNVGAEGYQFDVETSDGKAHSEQGQLQNVGSENESLSVKGSFKYIGDDGVTYVVNYIADENGFQPSGAHLPVGPQA